MKYLRRFNESIILEEELEIKDILSEIEFENLYLDIFIRNCKEIGELYNTTIANYIHNYENGYRFKTLNPGKKKIDQIKDIIEIVIRDNDDEKIIYKDIKESVERCILYMNSQGWRYIIDLNITYDLDSFNEEFNESSKFEYYSIRFYK